MLVCCLLYDATKLHQADKLQTWGMDESEICLDNDVSKASIINESPNVYIYLAAFAIA